MTEEVDLQSLFNQFFQRRYERIEVLKMAKSNEEIDLEDVFKALVLTIEDQKEEIEDLKRRVMFLENPDWDTL